MGLTGLRGHNKIAGGAMDNARVRIVEDDERRGHRSRIGPSGAAIARSPARREEGACRRS